jgi:hypothetical protein
LEPLDRGVFRLKGQELVKRRSIDIHRRDERNSGGLTLEA